MTTTPNPDVKNAIVRGAIGEAVLIAAAVALYFTTGVIWWIVGGALAGSALVLLLMLQAGAFSQNDE